MKVVRSVSFVVVMFLLFAGLAGCGPGVAGVTTSTPESQAATPTPESQDATPTPEIQGATPVAETYTDPFAYCATVGTADAPGPEYTGPDMPGAVVQGLQAALNVPETPLDVLENGSFWRCMDGEVYACFVGANLPCEAKADTERTPTQEETDFCQANPDSDLIPAVVTGRETVYEWRCREGTPEIVRQLFEPDAQGYLSDIWYRISPEGEGAALPNPAAQYCAEVGGSWSLETRPDGGQYGICLFEDNRQCEEWALLNGDCPVGGLKVTGYITPAAVYCALTGGEYTITGNSGAEDEQGTCTLPDGTECDVWGYYEGTCAPEAEPTAEAGVTIAPLPEEVCNGQAQAMSHALGDLVPTQSEEPLSDPGTGAQGMGCQAVITGTGEQFESPMAVVSVLGSMLEEQGWTADPMFVADGPTGTAAGYRKGDQVCVAAAMWQPDAAANCPQDQPISACDVAPAQQNYTVTLNCGTTAQEGAAPKDASGEQLVFDSTRGGGYRDLYVMNSDGSDMIRLTRGEADSQAGPWSPDGTRIVYTTFGLTASDIAVINTDGSGQINLTNTPDVDEGFPAWSPDGSRIAFTTRRDGNNEIYVMDTDGGNPVRLTDSAGDDLAPAWSPDGTRIAFVSDRDREPGIYDLYSMNADGSGVTRLTNDDAIDYAPAWSPDGTRIAFRSHHGGPADIYVIGVDGGDARNLTDSPGDDWAPSWSPDGTRIAFQTNRDGNWEIYVMTADGTEPVNVTQDPADDQLPFWKP